MICKRNFSLNKYKLLTQSKNPVMLSTSPFHQVESGHQSWYCYFHLKHGNRLYLNIHHYYLQRVCWIIIKVFSSRWHDGWEIEIEGIMWSCWKALIYKFHKHDSQNINEIKGKGNEKEIRNWNSIYLILYYDKMWTDVCSGFEPQKGAEGSHSIWLVKVSSIVIHQFQHIVISLMMEQIEAMNKEVFNALMP